MITSFLYILTNNFVDTSAEKKDSKDGYFILVNLLQKIVNLLEWKRMHFLKSF
jgi:hypothetical protein